MTDHTYQIVVTGQLVAGAELEQVKDRVAKLFNAPVAKLAPLFSGRRAVVKKGLDHAAAQRYVAVLIEAGLLAAAEPELAAAASAGGVAPTLAPVGVTLVDAPVVTPPLIDTSGLAVAAAGGNLVDYTPPPAPAIAIDHLAIAPAGARLIDPPVIVAPAIDTSRLSMGRPGETLVEPTAVEAPPIDISHLDMAPVGSDVGELRRTDFPPPPDTGHLKIE